jgi:hypothetical protein
MHTSTLPSSFHPLLLSSPPICGYVAGDVPDNEGAPPADAQVQIEDGIRASNSVEIMNDSESYEIARAIDSDNDRPVGELTESDVEMLRRIFSGRRDPMVHEFSDLTHLDQAFTEGCDDEL